MGRRGQFGEKITAITSLLILGLGFVALFSGFRYFWAVWVLGFAVVLPIVAILVDGGSESGESSRSEWNRGRSETRTTDADAGEPATESTADVLSILRERYARGELTDEQFERKLDRLFRTENVEDAADWRREAAEFERERTR